MAQNINLYEPPRKRQQRAVTMQGVASIAALLLLALGALHWVDRQKSSQLERDLARLRADHERIARQTAQLPASSTAERLQQDEHEVAMLEQIAARLTAGALGKSGSFNEHLQALARSTVEGVWLTGIRIDNGSNTLVLEGRALDAARVPQLFAALRREPLFAGLAFSTLEVKAVSDTGGQPTAAAAAGGSDAARQQVRFKLRTPEPVLATAPAAPAAVSAPVAGSSVTAVPMLGVAGNAAPLPGGSRP